MASILKVNEIHKSFGTTNVLDGVSFQMKEGERICLLGSSGSGKSTLLQIIAGLLEANEGEIEMNGKQVMSKTKMIPPEKRPVNMVFQDYALWPHMTIRENIEYGLKMKKVDADTRRERITSVTSLLQLGGLLDRKPAELSGGQQQRVGIARALATEPNILLMDEPLSNLDVKLRTEMRSELADILNELGITTIYVTHDMMEAFAIADRILVLHQGKVAQLAKPQEIYEEPKTIGVAQLMGYQNQLKGVIQAIDGNLAEIGIGEERLKGIILKDSHYVGEEVAVLFQLEAITLHESSANRTDLSNQMEAQVVQVLYEGSRWKCRLRLNDGQYFDAYATKEINRNEMVSVSLGVKQTRIF